MDICCIKRPSSPLLQKHVCCGAQLPHTYSKAGLCGAQLPHAVSDYQGPAPLIIGQQKIFSLTFICHIKSNYCLLTFIGYLLYQRAQLPFATKARMLWGPAPPHLQQGRALWGPAPPRCLRLSGPSSPDNRSTKNFFPNFYLPYKKQLLFVSFYWISVVSKGPAPLCYKSKKKFTKKNLKKLPHTYSKAGLCGAQLPHTVSDYQGLAFIG